MEAAHRRAGEGAAQAATAPAAVVQVEQIVERVRQLVGAGDVEGDVEVACELAAALLAQARAQLLAGGEAPVAAVAVAVAAECQVRADAMHVPSCREARRRRRQRRQRRVLAYVGQIDHVPRARRAGEPAGEGVTRGFGMRGRRQEILVVGLGRAEEGHTARRAVRRDHQRQERDERAVRLGARAQEQEAAATAMRPPGARPFPRLEGRGGGRGVVERAPVVGEAIEGGVVVEGIDDHAALRIAATARDGEVVERLVARGDGRPGEAGERQRRGRLHAAAQRRVDDEGAELRGEFVVVLGEQAFAAVLDELGGAAVAHGDHRQPGGARLERDNAERLVARRQREEVGGAQQRRDLRRATRRRGARRDR